MLFSALSPAPIPLPFQSAERIKIGACERLWQERNYYANTSGLTSSLFKKEVFRNDFSDS